MKKQVCVALYLLFCLPVAFAMNQPSAGVQEFFAEIRAQSSVIQEQEGRLLAFVNLLEGRFAAKGSDEQWVQKKRGIETLKKDVIEPLIGFRQESIKSLAQKNNAALSTLVAYGAALERATVALEALVNNGASGSGVAIAECQDMSALRTLVARNALRLSTLEKRVEALGLTRLNKSYRRVKKFVRGESTFDFVCFLGAQALLVGGVYFIDSRFERLAQEKKLIECRALMSARWLIGEVIDAIFRNVANQVGTALGANAGSIDRYFAGTSLDERGSKPFAVEIPALTYEKVLNLHEQKQRLEPIVSFIVDPQNLIVQGWKPIQAAVFIGKPGTGKTLLSKALAGEATQRSLQRYGTDAKKIKYIEVSHTSLKDIGLLNLIEQAKKESPCVLLLDELDKLLASDKSLEGDFLQVLDGFDGVADSRQPIVIIATANAAGMFSDALLREGRLGKPVAFCLPTCTERGDFLARIANNVSDQEILALAERMAGSTYKDLETMVQRAKIDSQTDDRAQFVTRMHEHVTHEILGIERLLPVCDEVVLERRAVHQAGHALLFLMLKPDEKLDVATLCAIVLPGDDEKQFGACIACKKDEGCVLETDEEVKKKLAICFAGTCAETVLCGSPNRADTCARHDAAHAQKLAAQLCADMYVSQEEHDKEKRTLLSAQKEQLAKTCELHKKPLKVIAAILREKKTLRAEELERELRARGVAITQ